MDENVLEWVKKWMKISENEISLQARVTPSRMRRCSSGGSSPSQSVGGASSSVRARGERDIAKRRSEARGPSALAAFLVVPVVCCERGLYFKVAPGPVGILAYSVTV